MQKIILIMFLSVVAINEAAGDAVWAWDNKAPKKNRETVNPGAASAVNPNDIAVMKSNLLSKWVEISRQNTYNIFVNPDYMTRTGDFVTMSFWYDLQFIDEVSGKQFRSVNAKAELDCLHKQIKVLSAVAYRDSMSEYLNPLNRYSGTNTANLNVREISTRRGNGVNQISVPGKWRFLTPGSTDEILWKYVCAK